MKLVMNRYSKPEKCKICTKIETKERSIRKEEDRIYRWRREENRSHSIDKAEDTIQMLQEEVARLYAERDAKQKSLSWYVANNR